jgi:hypothetical protein
MTDPTWPWADSHQRSDWPWLHKVSTSRPLQKGRITDKQRRTYSFVKQQAVTFAALHHKALGLKFPESH